MIAIVVVLLFSGVCFSSKVDVDLSPGNWPLSVLSHWEQLNEGLGPKQESKGTGGAAGETANALAVHIGQQAISKGGTAIDAAVATTLASITLATGKWISFAGIAEIVYYDSESKTTYNIQAPWMSVKNNNPFEIPFGDSGPNSVPIHGLMKALEEAHLKFGKISWASLLQPSIWLATNGFPVNYQLYCTGATNTTLQKTDYGRWLCEQLVSGGTVKQPDVADVLQAISEQGANYMYTGNWAQQMVDTLHLQGSNITMDDLLQYKVIWTQTTNIDFYNYTVFAPGITGYGGAELSEALQILQISKLIDKNVTNTTLLSYQMQIYRWSEAISDVLIRPNGISKIQSAYSDIFPPSMNITTLEQFNNYRKSTSYASQVWQLMSTNMDSFNQRLENLLKGITRPHSPPLHSDGGAFVDSMGSMCSIAHTINSDGYGSGIFVGGIALSNAGGGGINLQVWRNVIGRNKNDYIISALQPIIATSPTSNPASVLFTSIGTSLRPYTQQALVNLLALKMDTDASLNGKGFFHFDLTKLSQIGVGVVLDCAVNTPICQFYQKITQPFPRDIVLESFIVPYVSMFEADDAVNALSTVGLPVAITVGSGGEILGGVSSLVNGYVDVVSQ